MTSNEAEGAEGGQGHRRLDYMAIVPAMRRRQWAGDRLAHLRAQIEAITARAQVAWVDVKENGEFALYQAAHATVPVTHRG